MNVQDLWKKLLTYDNKNYYMGWQWNNAKY